MAKCILINAFLPSLIKPLWTDCTDLWNLPGEKGACLEMGPKQNLTQTLTKYSSENFTGLLIQWPEGTYGTHLA